MTSTLREAKAAAHTAWHALTQASYNLVGAMTVASDGLAAEDPHAISRAETELKTAARRYTVACELVAALSKRSGARK